MGILITIGALALLAAIYFAVSLVKRDRALSEEVRYLRRDRARVIFEIEHDRTQDALDRVWFFSGTRIFTPTSEEKYREAFRTLRQIDARTTEALRRTSTSDDGARVRMNATLREVECASHALARRQRAENNLAIAKVAHAARSK